MEIYALNAAAADTRRWAKTAPERLHDQTPGSDPYPPTRDEAKRYGQTEPSRDEAKDDGGGEDDSDE